MTTRDYVIRFEWGTYTDLTVTAGSFRLLAYNPSSARLRFDRERRAGHGERIRRVRRRNVTETMRLAVEAADMDANFALIDDIKRLLEAAGDSAEDGALFKPIVRLQRGSGDISYESRLYGGRVIEHPETMSIRWERDYLEITVEIVRRDWWEDSTGVALQMTNRGGTDVTSATVFNHTDAGATHDNFVKINAVDVPGDLLSQPRIAITNGTGADMRRVYVAIHGPGDPFNFTHTFEAEDATLEAITTSQASALASDGDFARSIWTTDVEEKLMTFTLGDTTVTRGWGKWFKIMTRFQTAPGASAPLVRFKMVFGGDILWEGEQIQLDQTDKLQDLGEIRIPPFTNIGGASVVDISLEMYGQITGGTTLETDFIQFMCKDGFRFYEPVAGGTPNTAIIRDEPPFGQVIEQEAAGDRITRHVATGEPIMMRPARDHQLHFLWDKNDGTHVIDDTCTIALQYFQRRATF